MKKKQCPAYLNGKRNGIAFIQKTVHAKDVFALADIVTRSINHLLVSGEQLPEITDHSSSVRQGR